MLEILGQYDLSEQVFIGDNEANAIIGPTYGTQMALFLSHSMSTLSSS